jgi:hypothetical protein
MADIISWDKAIDKKVKSSDNQDIGKVQSITNEYIQTKEGMVSKKYYFIPKYYFQGYDGDSLWVSLTKDEIKAKFEKEKEPEPAELETPEYAERRTTITKQYPDFDNNIPQYASTTSAAATTTATTTATTNTSPTAESTVGAEDSVGMPWEKIIDKKVKSSDNEDLGKVQSVATNYIEAQEGHVSKKRYYIPKHYIQGFDGENLHAALTKDEIKKRYERDAPPSESEFQNQEYLEQKRRVESDNPQFVHGIPFMAKEPGLELRGEYSGESLNIPWEEVIHKHVRTTDNVDIGDVERVGNEFIVVREGVAKVHIYYIPKVYINNYDGSSLWINAPSGLISAKFERATEPTQEEIRRLADEATSKAGSTEKF